MNFHLSLSQKAKDFIATLEEKPHPFLSSMIFIGPFLAPLASNEGSLIGNADHFETLELKQLLFVLKAKLNTLKSTEEKELFSLLLTELYEFLSKKKRFSDSNEETFGNRLKYLLLSLAGILYSACEGFDGIVAIFSVSPLPLLPVFIIGLAFALVSIFIFFALDIVIWSKAKGLKLGPNLLTFYKEEKEASEGFIKALSLSLVSGSVSTREELEFYASLLDLMAKRQDFLQAEREEFMAALEHPLLIFANHLILSLAAILAFSAGFFAGQTVAISLASLLLSTVAISFWPEVLFSGLVGLASLTLYFFLRKPELESLVSDWIGLDKEKILNLPDNEEVGENKHIFSQLNKGISRYKGCFFSEKQSQNEDATSGLSLKI